MAVVLASHEDFQNVFFGAHLPLTEWRDSFSATLTPSKNAEESSMNDFNWSMHELLSRYFHFWLSKKCEKACR